VNKYPAIYQTCINVRRAGARGGFQIFSLGEISKSIFGADRGRRARPPPARTHVRVSTNLNDSAASRILLLLLAPDACWRKRAGAFEP
jgi:hypothetical protein